MKTGPLAWLGQVAVVTWMNLKTVPSRWGSSSAAVVGVAGVVAVLVAVLSIAEGFRATMESTGSPDTVIILRGGSQAEMNSVLSREDTRIIEDAPGILRVDGAPSASAELFVVVDLPKRSTGTPANVPLRGVGPAAFEVRDDLEIVQGRRFTPGRNEVIAGVAAASEFGGLEVGRTLRWGDLEWTVVGLFESGGTVAESEIWCDAGVLQPAYRRGSTFQAVYARLTSPEAFEAFESTLTTDPRLDVSVQRETEYYAEQSRAMTTFISVLGTLVAGLMGVGAVFGALNTMYTAVSARTREIATLRALGFRSGPVVVSVLAESLGLALAGGLIGGGLAYAAFDGYRAATLNWQSFSQVAFAFRISPELMVQGLVYALLIGLLGGLFPALRAARLPVVDALREP
ncbi:MAG: ABC transporter permease [Acidobacteriota bacterium]|jgi:putative ABC transport system permease protein